MTHKITCGLEIHQQLNCNKLFCECPSEIKEGTAHYTVHRKQRAVVGETGEIDAAAAAEATKNKIYEYEAFDDNACLIELDEEPPRRMRKEALEAAIQMSKLLNMTFVDEVQVMRKTIVDGSNTSGFQRTSLVAMNGHIESSEGRVSVPLMIVEEDSARTIKNEANKKTYRIDRLGIPLLEISTGPDIHSPEQCQEVAEALGLLLRSTGKVKRGLGTIRQDVNISIPGGARVEIKGAQDLKLIPTLVRLEADRQRKLIEIKEELKNRGVKKVKAEIQELTEIFKNTESKIIKTSLEKKGKVFGIKLENFSGIVGKEIQPNRRLGTEFTDHAKVIAGLSIMHSDELPKFGITQETVDAVKQELSCKKDDAFIITAGQEERAENSLNAVMKRANQALKGVPKEVRRANPDGTSTFMRPMPGAARMYPATDALPIPLTKELIESVKIPELITEKIRRYEDLGIGKDLAELVAKSERAKLFDEFILVFDKVKPAYIGEILLTAERTIKRNYGIEISATDDDYADLFRALNNGKISKESVLDILKEKKPVKEVLKKFKVMSDKELEEILRKIIGQNKGMPANALIGKAMQELRGKAPGKKIVEMLKKLAN